MEPWILGLLYFTTCSRRVAAAVHRLDDLIAGGCKDRVVLPNRLEIALLASLDVEVTL